MKKILFSLIFLFVIEAQAQHNLEKGSFIVGLNGTANLRNNAVWKDLTWAATPSIGYFVLPNLAVGAQVTYAKRNFEMKDPTYQSRNNSQQLLAPELFVRYYAPLKVKPYVQISTGYGFQSSKSEFWGDYKSSNIVGSVGGGILFPVGKRFGIDVSYQTNIYKKSVLLEKPKGLGLGVVFKF